MVGHHAALAGVSCPSPVEAAYIASSRQGDSALTDADVQCSPARDRDADLPETFVDYEDAPREYSMNAVTTVLDVQTRASDLYNHPYDGYSPVIVTVQMVNVKNQCNRDDKNQNCSAAME